MIVARADTARLVAELQNHAARLARARAEQIALRRDESRWRRASLLWPLFGGDVP